MVSQCSLMPGWRTGLQRSGSTLKVLRNDVLYKYTFTVLYFTTTEDLLLSRKCWNFLYTVERFGAFWHNLKLIMHYVAVSSSEDNALCSCVLKPRQCLAKCTCIKKQRADRLLVSCNSMIKQVDETRNRKSSNTMHTIGHFTFWISSFAPLNRYIYSQASRSNYRGFYVSSYIYYLLLLYISGKELRRWIGLQTSDLETFALRHLQPTHLHHYFLL